MSVFTGTVITCDSCGEQEYRAASTNQGYAMVRAVKAGWVEIKNSVEYRWEWHCPTCVAADAQEGLPEEYYDDRRHQMKRD